jgi:hypothetical protein
MRIMFLHLLIRKINLVAIIPQKVVSTTKTKKYSRRCIHELSTNKIIFISDGIVETL